MMDWLTPRTFATPDRPALIWGDQALTYRDLWGWAAALKAVLAREGIAAGTRVAVLLPREPVAVAVIHALTALGAVLVPLNLRLTPAEMRDQIARSGATHLVATEATAARAREVAGERPVVVVDSDWRWAVRDLQLPIGATPAAHGTSHIAHGTWHTAHGTSHLALLFTSGTTGHPKAALLTAANFYWSAVASAFRLGVLPHDRWLLTLPLYHVGGLSILFRSALYGTAVVLPDAEGSFDPLALDAALRRHRVTLVSLVPTMLHRWLQAVPGGPPEHLRLVLLGGAAAPPEQVEEALARGFPVALTYGLTEAASQVATATPDEVRRKPGSVGRPLLYTQVRVVDEGGRDLPPGEVGEIVVRGPTVFAGYDGAPQATAAALRDGWLHTGDLGYLDEDGALWMVNRRSDLIVTGGENVYPVEVEAVLRQHPAVAEACVVGLDDPEWGQRVAAAVVLRPGVQATPAELEAHCRAHLAGYKVPRVIQFVAALPQTASGKVRRPAVKALLQQQADSTWHVEHGT